MIISHVANYFYVISLEIVKKYWTATYNLEPQLWTYVIERSKIYDFL